MRSLTKSLLTGAAVLTLSIAGTGSASAETIVDGPQGTYLSEVVQGTTNGVSDLDSSTYCSAQIQGDPNRADDYAEGLFDNHNSGFDCWFYLQNATDAYAANNTWFGVGSYNTTPYVVVSGANPETHLTAWYSDGPGWTMRACFKLHDPKTGWTGYIHCTHGI